MNINGIEAKMFHGASSIPSGSSNTVALIIPTANKYLPNYDTDAFLFSYDCSSKLKEELKELGISDMLEMSHKYLKNDCKLIR